QNHHHSASRGIGKKRRSQISRLRVWIALIVHDDQMICIVEHELEAKLEGRIGRDQKARRAAAISEGAGQSHGGAADFLEVYLHRRKKICKAIGFEVIRLIEDRSIEPIHLVGWIKQKGVRLSGV